MEKRNTIQKQLVLDAVSCLANHPTADEVYQKVVCKHPTISKATVYRNLGGMAEEGILRHILIPGGADRFDHCLTEHRHMLCTQCGKFVDSPIEAEAELDSMAAQATGFENVKHDIVYYGTCPSCTKKT